MTSPQVAVPQARFESHPSCLSRWAGVAVKARPFKLYLDLSRSTEERAHLHFRKIILDGEGWDGNEATVRGLSAVGINLYGFLEGVELCEQKAGLGLGRRERGPQ